MAEPDAVKKGAVRKIAVSGKGGTGKSTIVTLMADALRQQGYSVIVLDTDESNPGLCRMFGFEKEPRPLLALLSRSSPGEPEPDTEWLASDEITIDGIPSGHILSRDG